MLLPIAPTPPDTTAMRQQVAASGRSAAAMRDGACIGFGAPAPSWPTPQQAPNSRVVLDLPARIYALAAVLRLSERCDRACRSSSSRRRSPSTTRWRRLHGRGARQARHHRCAEGRAGPHRPARLHARAPEIGRRRLCQILRPVPHRRSDRSSSPSTCRNGRSTTAASSRPTSKPCWRAPRRPRSPRCAISIRSLTSGRSRRRARSSAPARSIPSTGSFEPERAGETRSAFMVAPSLDKRPVDDPEETVGSAAGQPAGVQGLQARRDTRHQYRRPRRHRARRRGAGRGRRQAVHLYQAHADGQGRRLFPPDRHCHPGGQGGLSRRNFRRLRTRLR